MRGIALLPLTAPLALVACGGGTATGSSKVDPVAYVRRSATRTAATPSEHMTETVTISAAGQNASITASGDFSNSPTRGSFKGSFSYLGHTLTLNEILAGTTLYVSSPLLSRQLPAGKKWVKAHFEKLGESFGIADTSLVSQTPAQAMRQLEAVGTVTEVGADTINGVATTHFRVENLDLSKIPRDAKLVASSHPKYGPVDVWIGNHNGYVYRENMSFSLSHDGVNGSITMSAGYSKFGEAVHVTVPPASQTVNGTNKALQGAGG